MSDNKVVQTIEAATKQPGQTEAPWTDPLVELMSADDAAMKVWAAETRARNRADTPPGLKLSDHLWHKAWLAWEREHQWGSMAPKLVTVASCDGEPHPWRVLEYHYDRLDYMGSVGRRLTIRYIPHHLADSAYTWKYEVLSTRQVLGSGVGPSLAGAHQAALEWLQQPSQYNAGVGFREALTEVIEQHEAALEARKIPQPERLGVAYVQQRVKAEVSDAGGAELGWTTRPITHCPNGTDDVHLGYVFDLSISIPVRAFNDAQLTDIIEALNALAAQATNAQVVEPTS